MEWKWIQMFTKIWGHGNRPERCIVTIASLDQWLATIEKHRYQWLADWKPLKNHWSQWLSRYHSINGNGHLRNHCFLAMVVNFLPLCLAGADIKEANDSFLKINNLCLSVLSKMCIDLCPNMYFHFSCHVCSQVCVSIFDIFINAHFVANLIFCEKKTHY